MIVVLLLIFQPNAQAIVDGKAVWVPSTQEEQLIRRVTVRFVMKTAKGMQPFCTGTVEGRNNILTAAHCFNSHNKPAKAALAAGNVYAEVFDSANPTQRRQIRVNNVDLEFDDKKDLAVARLDFPHGMTQSVPLAYGGCDSGSDVYMAGFGYSEEGKPSSVPRIARYSTAESADVQRGVLQKYLSTYHGTITEAAMDESKYLLAQRAKGQACFGDSGAPVFCKSKGILALAAVSGGITTTLPNKDKVALTPEFCRGRNMAVASRVSENRALLDQWLNSQADSSDPAATD